MIFIFRKEMQKWRYMLWVFVISIPLGYLASSYFGPTHPSLQEFARVNGVVISRQDYAQALISVQAHIAHLRMQAEQYGFSPDLFLAGSGYDNPEKTAFDRTVSEKLLAKIGSDLTLEIDPQYFIKEVEKTLPKEFFKDGAVNEEFLAAHLRQLNMTVPQFEESVETDLKRQVIMEALAPAAYVTDSAVRAAFIKENGEKSFAILTVPYNYFLAKVKQEEVDKKMLVEFFSTHQERYRVAEKREGIYWVINPQVYQPLIEVSAEDIEAFYEKNKTSLYRISPEISIRKIVFKLPKEASEDQRKAVKAKAQKVLDEAKEKPDSFSQLAKKHSEDKESSAKGGFVGFFKRGTYQDALETVAFRLQEPKQIGEMVQTDEGIVLVQLEDRKPATHKPLEEVRSEIIDVLKTRKAQHRLKSDLEFMRHAARSDRSAIDNFVKKHTLKEVATPQLTAAQSDGASRLAQVAKRLFSRADAQENHGYFADGKDFVIYREVGRKESAVPKLSDIVKTVEQDYFTEKARQELKGFVKQAKADVLTKKRALADLAKELGGTIKQTGMIKISDKVPGFEKNSGLISRSFDLTDPSQVLKYHQGDDYYLVQIEKIDQVDEEQFAQKRSEIARKEREAKKRLVSGSFVASLLRNATIEATEPIGKAAA